MLSDRTTGILFGVSVSCLGKSGVVGKQGGGQAGGQASGWPVGGQQAGIPVGSHAVGRQAGGQAGFKEKLRVLCCAEERQIYDWLNVGLGASPCCQAFGP